MSALDPQEQYDDAMFDYTTGDYDTALGKLQELVVDDPANFDAQLAVAMCHYRKGDFATAIAEGHKAERLRPNEQLVHTNLSLFYMRSGDKTTAEKHGLQARIASWKQDMQAPGTKPAAAAESEPELQMAQAKPKAFKLPEKFPEMPWKKQAKVGAHSHPSATESPVPPTPASSSEAVTPPASNPAAV
jgi:predicted Zn-dependent protease